MPPKVRHDRKARELTERKADLRRQHSRMRVSLEAAMCRGDAFTGEELWKLFEHPVLVPMLSRLILIGEGIVGYAAQKGRLLEDHAGKREPVKPGEKLRLAHAHDLLTGGNHRRVLAKV